MPGSHCVLTFPGSAMPRAWTLPGTPRSVASASGTWLVYEYLLDEFLTVSFQPPSPLPQAGGKHLEQPLTPHPSSLGAQGNPGSVGSSLGLYLPSQTSPLSMAPS